MEKLLSIPTLLLHFRALARSAHRIPSIRSIFTGRPRVQTFAAPPPARRTFERIIPLEPSPSDKSTSRRPTNRQIPFSRVYVLDPDTNKLSSAKRSLEELVRTEVDAKPRERRVVELVASHPEPVVRLTTRAEIEARYREMRRALKKAEKTGEEPKEVQLTWGVGRADMEHKLRKAGRDLEKGYRVVVVIVTKRGSRPPSREEWATFGDEVADMLSEIGEEWKGREFTERTMTLSFRKAAQGPVTLSGLSDI